MVRERSNGMNEQRRQELLAKFPAINNPRPMDPRANTQVQACVRAERIIKRVWKNLAAADVVLVDPAHVPALAARADAAAADFHRRASQGRLRYDTHDSDF